MTDERTEQPPGDAVDMNDVPEPTVNPLTPERFSATLEQLDLVHEKPVGEHAAEYDDVHRELQRALDDVDQAD